MDNRVAGRFSLQRARYGALVVAHFMTGACSGGGSSDDTPVAEVTVAPEITAWLRREAIPFETPLVRDDRRDLEGLGALIGDARVVSLGEATHGTREFFQMKHRILDYLVKEKGFTHFAMEASWPEMNRIDDWVLGGKGDPEVLLSGQYFWTWRTSAVLTMMRWTREYNASRGSAPPVHFLGFDMQHPGMAIYNVQQFLEPIDPEGATWAGERYRCVDANSTSGAWPKWYTDRSETYQNECRGNIDKVYEFLANRTALFEAATSASAFARALQSARLIQQFDDMAARRMDFARDRAMAENIEWLLDHAGPEAKIVLWAHNMHVNDRRGATGSFLRDTFGSQMIIVGFTFYEGEFIAETPSYYSTTSAPPGLDTQWVGPAPAQSYEWFFHEAGPRFILDLRNRDLRSPATSWLAGPRARRRIGTGFKPMEAYRYFVSNSQLPLEFDAMIFFDQGHHSNILPFVPPNRFDGTR